MLKVQIKNYDEFREIFGTRCSSRGCIQNKVLLSFWKYRFAIDHDGRATQIRSMQELFNLLINDLMYHHITNGVTFMIKGDAVAYHFESAIYRTPPKGCIDYANPGNIKYLDTKHVDRNNTPKLCSMGAGRFLRKIIEEHHPRVPESVITYCSEEFQRIWEADVSKLLNGYELVIDKHFDYIYSSDHLCNPASFGSCMVGKGQHSFYDDCVNASAAYLKKDGKIYARCIIYHDVETIDGKKHNYAERQYAYNQSELLKTLLINKLVDGKYIDLYKVIGAGCRDIRNIIDVKTGKKLEDARLKIKCTIPSGHILSFMDTFKWYYPKKRIASNYDFSTGGIEIDHTTPTYTGPDPSQNE